MTNALCALCDDKCNIVHFMKLYDYNGYSIDHLLCDVTNNAVGVIDYNGGRGREGDVISKCF